MKMVEAVSRRGIRILYKCYRLPDYGRRCADAFKKCHTCKYCKAEMKAEDATKLMNRYLGC